MVDNINVLVAGEPGAGKSNLCRYLIAQTPRSLTLDPKREHEPAHGTEDGSGRMFDGGAHGSDAFQRVVDFLVETNRTVPEDFHVVYRPRLDEERTEGGLLMMLAERMQSHFYERAQSAGRDNHGARLVGSVPPLALFLDESWNWSDSGTMSEPLARLYRLGRAWRVNILAAVQVDSELHKVMKHCTTCFVTMRQQKLTGWAREHFALSDVRALETLRWKQKPEQGRHFLVSTGVDLLDAWEERNAW